MFGIFKSKKVREELFTEEKVAEELFSQILSARDEAKEGGIIDEKVFNDRLNTMYTAGYLVGYVDHFVSGMSDDDAKRREKSKIIFEKMFPGTGFDFVRAKLKARQDAVNIPQESENYQRIAQAVMLFDVALDDAQKEVENYVEEGGEPPRRLKEFLLLGDVKSLQT